MAGGSINCPVAFENLSVSVEAIWVLLQALWADHRTASR